MVYYQPKARLSDGAIIGAEALVRWQHPEYGMLPPDDFISIAERSGLIGSLTHFVVRRAIAQCRDVARDRAGTSPSRSTSRSSA